jgi:transcription elongation factor Elf1
MSAAMSLEELYDEAVARSLRTTVLFRLVDFVCPDCGDERSGAHVDGDDGITYVECSTCHHDFDVSVLRVPTQARLDAWRADAVLHGTTALQCADGVHRCSYLALASCRRLAPELTSIGKTRLLDELVRAIDGEPNQAQRGILVELGVALGLPAPVINGYLALL